MASSFAARQPIAPASTVKVRSGDRSTLTRVRHATSEADRAIAQAVSDAVKSERKKAKKAAAGTSGKPKAKGKKAGKKHA